MSIFVANDLQCRKKAAAYEVESLVMKSLGTSVYYRL